MKTPLKEFAKVLLEAGYVVFGWQNDIYTEHWREGDYVSLIYGKVTCKEVASVGFNEFGRVRYGRSYIPSRENGSGCRMMDEGILSLSCADAVYSASLPNWWENKKKPTEYKNIYDWYKNANNKVFHELTIEEVSQ